MYDFKKKCLNQVQSIAEQINNLADNYVEFYQYFNNVPDTKYRVTLGSNKYNGAYIYLSSKGPKIWVDTFKGTVELIWGCESASCFLKKDVLKKIDDIFENLYYCQRNIENLILKIS